MADWARRETPRVIAAGLGKRETDRFIDHWRQAAGATARKIDWKAAWRNWMRRAEDDMPGGPRDRAAPRRGGAADPLTDQRYGPGSTVI